MSHTPSHHTHHHAYRVRYGVTIVIASTLAILCLGPGTQSFSKDEDSAETHVPVELVEKVKTLLLERFPDGEVVGDDEDRLRFQSHCHKFNTHANGKHASWPVNSDALRIPAADGIELGLEWSDNYGQAGGAGDGRFGQVTGEDFCWRYTNFYKLPNGAGYIRLSMKYGTQVDKAIIDLVRAELATVGEEAYEDRPDRWRQKAAKAQEKLTAVLKKAEPQAIWRQDVHTLICEFNTMEFDVHAIDEKGNVAADAHRETGPQEDGFIIRLSPIEPPLRRQSRPVYGRSHGPYWSHYNAIYNEFSDPIRLDILYGVKTDKMLLEEVTDTLDEMFGKPERF